MTKRALVVGQLRLHRSFVRQLTVGRPQRRVDAVHRPIRSLRQLCVGFERRFHCLLVRQLAVGRAQPRIDGIERAFRRQLNVLQRLGVHVKVGRRSVVVCLARIILHAHVVVRAAVVSFQARASVVGTRCQIVGSGLKRCKVSHAAKQNEMRDRQNRFAAFFISTHQRSVWIFGRY